MTRKQLMWDVVVLVVISLSTLVLFYCVPVLTDVQESSYEAVTFTTTEETEEYINCATETEMPTEEATEASTEATEPTVVLYDVPLDEELQQHIISEAEEHGIDPAIVMAMAWKESTYRTDAIGDNGNSMGLLQIQPRWHSGRMDKLGCANLLDPYQNVTVGVDYLCELLSKYGDMGKALTAYNRGHYAGEVTNYAWTVMAKAEELVIE